MNDDEWDQAYHDKIVASMEDKMKEYPKVHYIDHEECEGLFDGDVIIQEKVDGSNFRWVVEEDGEVHFGTHKKLEEEVPTEFVHPTDPTKIRAYAHGKDFILHKINQGAYFLRGYVYFGEIYGNINIHRIDYGIDFDVAIFDVWDGERFLDDDKVRILSVNARMTHVPRFTTDEWKECLEEMKEKKREGVVIKNYGKQLFGKVVIEKFKELASQKFGSKVPEDAFTLRTVTNARVFKIAAEIERVVGKCGMELTPRVISTVWRDIILEELPSFILQKKPGKLDFKKMKHLATKRTVDTFKMILAERRMKMG